MSIAYIEFQVQVAQTLLTLQQLELQERKVQARYPAGTIVDGVNVGGKWMSGDKGSSSGANKAQGNSSPKIPEPLDGNASKLEDSKLSPDSEKVLRTVLNSAAGDEIKSELKKLSDNPSRTEGIEKTSFSDVLQGAGDVLKNIGNFIKEKINTSGKFASEHKKEIAIGACMVAGTVIATIVSTSLGLVVLNTVLNTKAILQMGQGVGVIKALGLAVKTITPKSIMSLVLNKQGTGLNKKGLTLIAIAAYRNIKNAFDVAKLFPPNKGKKFDISEVTEESVKKTLEAEGINYDEVQKAITRREEKTPDAEKVKAIETDIKAMEADEVDIQKEAQRLGNKIHKEMARGVYSIDDHDAIDELPEKLIKSRDAIIVKKGELSQAEGRGFSLRKRTKELAQVAKEEGIESSSYKWRADVVKAELKYGEKLDSLDRDGGYESLLVSMKKEKPAPGSYTLLSESDTELIKILFEASKPNTPKKIMPIELEKAKKEGLDLHNYLVTPLNIKIGLDGSQASSRPGGYSEYDSSLGKIFNSGFKYRADKNVDAYMNIGDVYPYGHPGYDVLASQEQARKSIMWHESGHVLEWKLGLVEESVAFREDRAEETPENRKDKPSLSTITATKSADEYAIGDFYHFYIGTRIRTDRFSSKDAATEVLSSGMELLSSPALAKRGIKRDRETMLYALSAMDKKIEDKEK